MVHSDPDSKPTWIPHGECNRDSYGSLVAHIGPTLAAYMGTGHAESQARFNVINTLQRFQRVHDMTFCKLTCLFG